MEEERVQFCKVKRKSKQKIDNFQIWIRSAFNKENNKGSWCAISIDDKKDITTLSGIEKNCNKNQIELVPLLEILEWIIDESERKKHVIIFTNSSYVINVIQEWIDKWKKNNFMINEDKERPNADILRKIDNVKQNMSVTVKLLMKENDFSTKAAEIIKDIEI